MITNKIGGNLAYKYEEFYGLSSDEKPIKAFNGSIFVEMDTAKIFYFDEDSTSWKELGKE